MQHSGACSHCTCRGHSYRPLHAGLTDSCLLHDPALLCMLPCDASIMRGMEACRGGEEEEEEPGTPVRPGSGLLDKGSVQRLASRLNERIASEEQSCSPTARLSVSPSPMVRPSYARPLVVPPYRPVQCGKQCSPSQRPPTGHCWSSGHHSRIYVYLGSRSCTAGKQHLHSLEGRQMLSCTGESSALSASMRYARRPACVRRSWPTSGRSSCSARRARTRLIGCALTHFQNVTPNQDVPYLCAAPICTG